MVDPHRYSELQKIGPLYQDVIAYRPKSRSTGCSPNDYAALYHEVRRLKPRHVLECGGGISTLAITHALRENCAEGISGHCMSMEELPQFHVEHCRLHPHDLQPFVDFVLSPREDAYFYCFRGVRYVNVPRLPYEFVFVDGPHMASVADAMMCCDLDYLDVVRRSSSPVCGLMDGRLMTAFVLQSILPAGTVRVDANRFLAFLGPCMKDDIPILTALGMHRTLLERASEAKDRFSMRVTLR